MRVAIAGNGDLARYMIEEFPKMGHEIMILTRSHKSQFAAMEAQGVTQFVTDYSPPSLAKALQDRDILISTIGEFGPSYMDIHRALIEACQQSPTCKRFIPPEFAGDIQTYPDQPAWYARYHDPLRRLLSEQTQIEYTLVCLGWLANYLVPARNRYIREIGIACPINLADNEMVIPGTGNEPNDFTWARDVAKALGHLINAPAGSWEPYTFVSGEQTTWNEIAAMVKAKYRPDISVRYVSIGQIVETIKTATDEDSIILGEHQMLTASRANSLPPEKVQAQRQKYFSGMHFRTLQDGLAEFDRDESLVV